MAKDWDESGKAGYDAGYGPKLGIQAGIDEVMRDVAHVRISQSQSYFPARRAEGPASSGKPTLVEPKPITMPPGQDIIQRLVDAALPHGVKRDDKA